METKLCYIAYLDEKCLHTVIKKHVTKKEEKKLDTVRALPYFQGVTRNTHKRIISALQPQIIEMNQVLIRQGTANDKRVVYIVHEGEFEMTREIQNSQLALPSSQSALVKNRLRETKLPVQTISVTMLRQGSLVGLEDQMNGMRQYSYTL